MRTRIILSTLVVVLATNISYAQSAMNKRAERMERIEVQKTAYITQKVELTTSEAQQFWPLHNEFEGKMRNLRKGDPEVGMPGMQRKAEVTNMSDKDLKQLFEDRFNTEQAVLDLKKEYHAKFLNILTPQKVAKLYDAERSFKKELLKQLKEQGRP